MTTPVGAGPRPVPWVGLTRPDAVRNFGVRWEVVHALPFAEANGITNPWNEGQPLRVSRDGQEVHPAAGRQFVAVMRAAAERALREGGGGGAAAAGGGGRGLGRHRAPGVLGAGEPRRRGVERGAAGPDAALRMSVRGDREP
jgi:hypothetical protein